MTEPATLDHWTCCVCTEPIEEDPHTYHATGCGARLNPDRECAGESDDSGTCGDDCHAECCPVCHPPPTKLSWTQPCCESCWFEIRGVWAMERVNGRDEEYLVSVHMPVRLTEPVLERCAYCGGPTIFGVYRRQDPTTVPYPKAEEQHADP